MKYLIILYISICCGKNILSQREVDTFNIQYTQSQLLDYFGYQMKTKEDIYIINYDTVTEKQYNDFSSLIDSIEILYSNNYCIFYSNGKIHEAGIWNLGNFTGGYTSYYSNGNIMMKGKLDELSRKIGKWVYYYENGDTKKIRNHKKGKWYRTVKSPQWE